MVENHAGADLAVLFQHVQRAILHFPFPPRPGWGTRQAPSWCCCRAPAQKSAAPCNGAPPRQRRSPSLCVSLPRLLLSFRRLSLPCRGSFRSCSASAKLHSACTRPSLFSRQRPQGRIRRAAGSGASSEPFSARSVAPKASAASAARHQFRCRAIGKAFPGSAALPASRRPVAPAQTHAPSADRAMRALPRLRRIQNSPRNPKTPRGRGQRATRFLPQHFLNFLPLPQGQGSFRPTFTPLYM